MALKKKKTNKTGTKKGKKLKRTTSKKKVSKKASVFLKFDQINKVINRLEGEVESLVKKLVKQGERSRRELRKNFNDILAKIRSGKLLARASETREELEKEVRRLADEVIGTVKEVESLINSEKVSDIFQNARQGVVSVVEFISENGFVTQARETLINTRREFYSLLSIPTQTDVEKLEKKIVRLERRLGNLTKKVA